VSAPPYSMDTVGSAGGNGEPAVPPVARNAYLSLATRTLAACRPENQVACLLLDIDNFHDVNAFRGHDIGDVVLAVTASRISAVLRDGDGCVRVGDDEFAVVLGDLLGSDHAMLAARRILDRVASPIAVAGQSVAVRGRMGVALAAPETADADALLRDASVALHRAKTARRAVVVYEQGLNRRVRVAVVEQELRAALEQNRVFAHYQPKVQVTTGEVTGVEALARLATADGELMMPGTFIPVAEQSDLITAVTTRILSGALRQCAQWEKADLHLQVAVNVSPRMLTEDDALPDVTEQLLELWGVDPGRLTLEITESLMVDAFERAPDLLRILADSGVRLSIDDFGQGYSSLAYLQSVPARELKIDQAFVRTLDTDAGNRTLVRAMAALGRDFGMEVVAEGVESRAVWDQLAALGCDYGQGHFLSWGLDGVALAEAVAGWRASAPWH
jgi:diguanylate cyclase (GGDEF)-like protein